jgi:hypothetical protein
MKSNKQEKRLLEKAKDLLNEGAEKLDSQTTRRLEHIRLAALSATEKRHAGFLPPSRWVTVGAFATAAMAVVAVVFWLRTSPGDFPDKDIEDLEIIASKEQVDFYENLEFYRWLATKENGA